MNFYVRVGEYYVKHDGIHGLNEKGIIELCLEKKDAFPYTEYKAKIIAKLLNGYIEK